MIFAIYDLSSGYVKRSIDSSFTPSEGMLMPGEGIVEYTEGFDRLVNYKVVEGVPVPQPAPLMTEEDLRKRAQAEINSQARAYLASTDWYVTRFAETGVAIPADITAARSAARTYAV